MTTYVQCRDALVAKINTALTADYPNLKVFWENTTTVDPNTVGSMFMQVEVNFQDAVNTTMDADPAKQYLGVVNFRVSCKEGQGVRAALALFDYLTNLMKFQIVPITGTSGVTLNTPKPGRKQASAGWEALDLNAPFFFRSA